MDLASLASLVAMLAAMSGLYWGLRRDLRQQADALRTVLKADIRRLDERVSHLDDRVSRLDDRVSGLDDRVYALATGLKPLTDRARGTR